MKNIYRFSRNLILALLVAGLTVLFVYLISYILSKFITTGGSSYASGMGVALFVIFPLIIIAPILLSVFFSRLFYLKGESRSSNFIMISIFSGLIIFLQVIEFFEDFNLDVFIFLMFFVSLNVILSYLDFKKIFFQINDELTIVHKSKDFELFKKIIFIIFVAILFLLSFSYVFSPMN